MGRGARRGGAAVEFALTIPFLLMLVGALVDLSRFITFHQLIGRAARDGARVGSVTSETGTPNGLTIRAAAVSHATTVLEEMGYPCSTDCAISATWDLESNGYYYVTVDVSYPFQPLTGLVPGLATRPAQATFTMLTQQQVE